MLDFHLLEKKLVDFSHKIQASARLYQHEASDSYLAIWQSKKKLVTPSFKQGGCQKRIRLLSNERIFVSSQLRKISQASLDEHDCYSCAKGLQCRASKQLTCRSYGHNISAMLVSHSNKLISLGLDVESLDYHNRQKDFMDEYWQQHRVPMSEHSHKTLANLPFADIVIFSCIESVYKLISRVNRLVFILQDYVLHEVTERYCAVSYIGKSEAFRGKEIKVGFFYYCNQRGIMSLAQLQKTNLVTAGGLNIITLGFMA